MRVGSCQAPRIVANDGGALWTEKLDVGSADIRHLQPATSKLSNFWEICGEDRNPGDFPANKH